MEGNLESALRRAACWAPRGMATGAQLLAGTEGRLRFEPRRENLYARLPSGEEVYVGLSTRTSGSTLPASTATTGSKPRPTCLPIWSRTSRERRLHGSPARWRSPSPTARWPGSARPSSPRATGSTFTRRISWAFDGGGSVAVEARAATLDACDERIAGHVLRLWPELEEAARVAVTTVTVAGWLVFDRRRILRVHIKAPALERGLAR